MKTADALRLYEGNCAALGKAIGYTRQPVRLWGELVPLVAAEKLHRLHPCLPHDREAYVKLSEAGQKQRSRNQLKRWRDAAKE